MKQIEIEPDNFDQFRLFMTDQELNKKENQDVELTVKKNLEKENPIVYWSHKEKTLGFVLLACSLIYLIIIMGAGSDYVNKLWNGIINIGVWAFWSIMHLFIK